MDGTVTIRAEDLRRLLYVAFEADFGDESREPGLEALLRRACLLLHAAGDNEKHRFRFNGDARTPLEWAKYLTGEAIG